MSRVIITIWMLCLVACSHSNSGIKPEDIKRLKYDFNPPITVSGQQAIKNDVYNYNKAGISYYDNYDRDNADLIINNYYSAYIQPHLKNEIHISNVIKQSAEKYNDVEVKRCGWDCLSVKSKYSNDKFADVKYSFNMVNDNLIVNFNSVDYGFGLEPYKPSLNIQSFLNNLSLELISNDHLDKISIEINRKLKTRIYRKSAYFDKKEMFYKVSLATAKSRLQRAINNFSYDDSKTFFILKKSNIISCVGRSLDLNNSFAISLYPEGSGTIIVFSGSYEFLEDTFNNNNEYGKSLFYTEMASIQNNVDKIMNAKR